MDVTGLIERLARRGELEGDDRARVESEAVSAILSSHEAVARLALPLHVYFPEAFAQPAVRAALHLALESDALRIDQRFRVVQPLLATEDRFEEVLAHGERLALGARMRIAALCRRVAELVQAFGPEALLAGGRALMFDRVVATLFRDRDATVAMHAAWAAGLRAVDSRPLEELLEFARGKQAPPELRRRALVSAVARAFDSDPAALDVVLGSELIAKEPSARALVVRALAFAPAAETAMNLALQLLEGTRAPEVGLAAAEHALDRETHEQVFDAVRSKDLSSPSRKLRFLLGPRSSLAEQLFLDLVKLRDAARKSASLAHATAVEALARAASAAPSDEVDVAIEMLLFDSTQFRDALAATDDGVARRRLWTDWVRVVARTRTRAIDTLSSAKGGALREALSRTTRAMDASPRGFGREGAAADELRTAIASDAARLLQVLGPHLLAREPDRAVARPLAHGFVTALEVESLTRGTALEDALCVLACSDESVVGHAARATTLPRFADAISGLASLRATIEAPIERPAVLVAAVRDTIAAVHPITSQDSPLRRTLEALVVAIDARSLMARGELADATGPWSRTLAESVALRQRAQATVGFAGVESGSERRRTAAVTSLYGRSDAGMPRENAMKAIAAALPPLLSGVPEALEVALERQNKLPTAPKIELAPGSFVGDFVVDRALGKGGMGSCLLVRRRVAASDPRAPRFVLKLPLQRDPQSISLFIDEATTLLQLTKSTHPGVVEFIACATKSYRLPFLVMGWVDGKALDERVRTLPLPPREAIQLGASLADALAHCHYLGITHHDLKPANIVLSARDGRPVLVDFGIASSAQKTGAGSIQYMSPERYSPTNGPTWPADVFALACVIIESVTGRPLLDPPLHGNERQALASVASVADAIMAGTPVGLGSAFAYYMSVANNGPVLAERIRRAVGSGTLADVLIQMIATDPAQRPRASHVATVLRSMR